MENLAHLFDQPTESQDHQELATTAWMGGELVSMRYWLGRLLHRNFFRETDDAVKAALHEYLVEIGCTRGAKLVYDFQSWSSVATFLQSRVDSEEGNPPTKNRKLVSAIQAVLMNPDQTNAELAANVDTTEKQIARMTDVFVLRKMWKLQKV